MRTSTKAKHSYMIAVPSIVQARLEAGGRTNPVMLRRETAAGLFYGIEKWGVLLPVPIG